MRRSLMAGRSPLACVLLLLLACRSAVFVYCASVDTRFPVRLEPTLRSGGSHFGFALAADARSSRCESALCFHHATLA